MARILRVDAARAVFLEHHELGVAEVEEVISVGPARHRGVRCDGAWIVMA